MIPQHVAMGLGVILLSLVGWAHQDWLLTKSGHGRRLTRWFGPQRDRTALRIFLIATFIFGTLLATGYVRSLDLIKF